MTWTWAITVLSLVGVVLNVYKKRACFIVWLFTNATWTIVDFYHGLYSQSALFAVYTAFAIFGLWKWRNEK